MSNLQYLLNERVVTATVTPSTEATGYDADNLVSGWRGDWWKAGEAGVSHTIKYQVAADRGAADAFALVNLDWAASDVELTVTVETSENDSDWTEMYSEVIAPASLYGPAAEDFVYKHTSASTAASVYWRLTLAGASFTPELGKFYCGSAFDPGRDPQRMSVKRLRGTYFKRPRYEIAVEYSDITYAKAVNVLNWIYERADYHPIVIFTTSDHDALFNYRMLYCQVVDCNLPQRITGHNSLSLLLRECI